MTATERDLLLKRITERAGLCGGRACIRGMRIHAVDVLGLLASGLTPEEITRELPDLEEDDVRACLHYAVQLAEAER